MIGFAEDTGLPDLMIKVLVLVEYIFFSLTSLGSSHTHNAFKSTNMYTLFSRFVNLRAHLISAFQSLQSCF